MYWYVLRTDPHDHTEYQVWNYAERDWAYCIDKLYDKADGWGYTTKRYATRIMQKLVRAGESNLSVVSFDELIEHIDNIDWSGW